MTGPGNRKPQVFELDDPELALDAPRRNRQSDLPVGPQDELAGGPDPNLMDEDVPLAAPDETATLARAKRGLQWGAIFLSAVSGLIAMAFGIWVASLAADYLGRNDIVGWTAFGLLVIAGIAALMLLANELISLSRLGKVVELQRDAQRAFDDNDKAAAEKASRELKALFRTRPEMAWPLSRLEDHAGEIMNAREQLALVERELMTGPDADSRKIITKVARQVSVVTALSPATVLDMILVAAANLRMIRQLASVYGGRPGMIGVLRLARMVATHIALTGGISIADDLVHQLVGHGVTARLSAKLGEGVVNGALTARIGLACLDVCRPLPFIEASKPRFRDVATQALKFWGQTPPQQGRKSTP